MHGCLRDGCLSVVEFVAGEKCLLPVARDARTGSRFCFFSYPGKRTANAQMVECKKTKEETQ